MMVIKQRKTDAQEELEQEDDIERSADSYFPLDVAYQASCGSNLLFRVEIQEYENPLAVLGGAK